MDKNLLRAQLLMEAADLLAETSMDDLEKQKEQFWKNHAARKKVLDDALRDFNKSSKRNKEDEDENDKKFKEIDDKLNSLLW